MKKYKDRFGDCNIPIHSKGEHAELGRWVNKQRSNQNAGWLTDNRRARLDELGFVWDAHTAHWETMFAELRSYKGRFGDCDVPQAWKENPRLGRWTNVQRLAMTRGTLSTERKTRLDALGFIWNAVDSKWEARLAELKDYERRFGDCNVPDRWAANPQLGMWVQNQRMFEKRGELLPERKALLDALGFEWDVRDANWDAMFGELKRYKQRFGDCNVPITWMENRQLARWVSKQRARQREGTLPADRKARLNALGFEWAPKTKRSRVKAAI